MSKSQKNLALDTKPQISRKLRKTHPKTVVKVSNQPEKPERNSKQDRIVALLKRQDGATIEEMAKATGWQRHSVHGMMSGVLRKRLGLSISSGVKEHGRVYRITASVSRS